MEIIFDTKANENSEIKSLVEDFLSQFTVVHSSTLTIYQDLKSESYFVKCHISSANLHEKIDFDARLDPDRDSSYRANRELLLKHNTYSKMKDDALKGRSFHDIIVEYSQKYNQSKPLKIWGGQHRLKAITEVYEKSDITNSHGFRIYFNLSKDQRTDLALISNTNISVSNDLFDRTLEETKVGTSLREWCVEVGLLKEGEDFPDNSSKTEKINVRLARTFIVNFFKGKESGQGIKAEHLDKNIYAPHLCESGSEIDTEYVKIVNKLGKKLWESEELKSAGKCFANLNQRQRKAIEENDNIKNRKGYRNKALTPSVLSAWAYAAGLLQIDDQRMKNLYNIPASSKECPDPLNAEVMSKFKHEQDEPTYRGLGTRTALKDRQRMVQVFLAKSSTKGNTLTKKLLNQAVNQVVGISALSKGYG